MKLNWKAVEISLLREEMWILALDAEIYSSPQ